MPIMNDFEEIETCVECSARNLKNIREDVVQTSSIRDYISDTFLLCFGLDIIPVPKCKIFQFLRIFH
jgi:hypothetical protein